MDFKTTAPHAIRRSPTARTDARGPAPATDPAPAGESAPGAPSKAPCARVILVEAGSPDRPGSLPPRTGLRSNLIHTQGPERPSLRQRQSQSLDAARGVEGPWQARRGLQFLAAMLSELSVSAEGPRKPTSASYRQVIDSLLDDGCQPTSIDEAPARGPRVSAPKDFVCLKPYRGEGADATGEEDWIRRVETRIPYRNASSSAAAATPVSARPIERPEDTRRVELVVFHEFPYEQAFTLTVKGKAATIKLEAPIGPSSLDRGLAQKLGWPIIPNARTIALLRSEGYAPYTVKGQPRIPGACRSDHKVYMKLVNGKSEKWDEDAQPEDVRFVPAASTALPSADSRAAARSARAGHAPPAAATRPQPEEPLEKAKRSARSLQREIRRKALGRTWAGATTGAVTAAAAAPAPAAPARSAPAKADGTGAARRGAPRTGW